MSQQNVDIVQAGFAAWNAGDMAAFREMYHPDVVARWVEDWPESGPFVGRDAVMRSFEGLRETWDVDALELLTVLDAGDRVVVKYLWRGVGHGPDLNMEQSVVITLRGGRVVHLQYFWCYEDALAAAGVPH